MCQPEPWESVDGISDVAKGKLPLGPRSPLAWFFVHSCSHELSSQTPARSCEGPARVLRACSTYRARTIKHARHRCAQQLLCVGV